MTEAKNYLQALRAATEGLHGEVEKITEGDRFLSGEFDRAHYAAFLFCHYLFHVEIGRHIAHWPSLEGNVLDWPACKRIQGLQSDLSSLGLSHQQTSSYPSLPIESPAFAVGLCYVSEGSVLGSKQIYGALKDHPTFSTLGADQFFLIGKENLSERWNAFRAILLRHAEQEYPAVESGAIAGFELFAELWKAAQSQVGMSS